MSKKLLIDLGSSLRLQLTESTVGDNRFLFAKGEFGRADVATQNRRIYPRNIWEREIRKIYEAMSQGKVMGELDHPQDGKTSLKRVSHLMSSLSLHDDGTIYGEAKILLNDHGKQLRSILEAGGAIGVSSRGMGSTSMNEDGFEVVQDDYGYMTHDFVADPAVITSYPRFQTEVRWIEPKTVIAENNPSESKLTEESSMEKTEKESAQKLVESEIQKKLEEQKVQLLKESEAVLAEKVKLAKEEALTEAKKILEADPKYAAANVAFEDVKKAVRAFILPEDTETVVRAKDAEIASLKESLAKLESDKKDSEKKLVEKIEEIGNVADRLAAHLHFYKKLSESGSNLDAMKKLVGTPKAESVAQVDSLFASAKKSLDESIAQEAKLAQIKKELEEKYAAEQKALKERNEKLDGALQESLRLNKELGMMKYVEEKTRGNPNASKIRGMCEGKTNRKEVDEIIKRFAVAPVVSEDYNAFRRRVSRVENTSLVESHLAETGNEKPISGSSEAGVLGEMKDLFPGATLDQVESLMKNG